MEQRSLAVADVVAEDTTLTLDQKLRIRAAANEWISDNFPEHRKFLTHSSPDYHATEGAWSTRLVAKDRQGKSVSLGQLLFDRHAHLIRDADSDLVLSRLKRLIADANPDPAQDMKLLGRDFEFRLGDGIEGIQLLQDKSVDLLLTDPPYGISKAYTCESQVPKRLRKDGTDFIMPRGNFGDWDGPIAPREWTQHVLPKVGGWFVTFCAQAQIGEYSEILREHKFVAVGTLVWQKTNPVPFNHRYKPINAWEALVIGKRPGAKFHGNVVHNVFVEKSPSPQQRIHPTQKPLPLIERFVELFSGQGELVVDPFAGSATTVIAGIKAGRRVIAYERDPAIFQAAFQRLAQYQKRPINAFSN